ncbi:hypothetical protein LCGC14_1201190, partial [marine sediment metagenome]
MATITEEQRKANQEIINALMKVLGIDNIENIKDFSIHVRQNDVIQTEVSFFNTEFQIEKIMKIFIFNSKGERIDVTAMDRMNPESKRDLYSKWRTIEPGKVYDEIHIKDSTPDLKGTLTLCCFGEAFINTFPKPSKLQNNDLVLDNLKGIKEIVSNIGTRVFNNAGEAAARGKKIPTDHELRNVLYHNKLYNNVYCKAVVDLYDPEGIVIQCSGDVIMGRSVDSNEGVPEDLIVDDLSGIKEIIAHVKEMDISEFKKQ